MKQRNESLHLETEFTRHGTCFISAMDRTSAYAETTAHEGTQYD
jgi:hypothetical protein